jgi:hypothetical protein
MPAPELNEALRSQNHSSAVEWAAQFPTLSVVELARRLSGGIAPMSLQKELAKEARARGEFPQFVRGMLVRLLNGEFPRGIGAASSDENGLSSVWSMWVTSFDPDQRAVAETIWNKVVAELRAHPDWVPQHADEPRLLALFKGQNLDRSKRAALVADAWARIDARLADRRTARERISALSELPAGYGFLYATSRVDAEVRNGGFSQLFANNGGLELPLAIIGMRALKTDDLAALLEEAIAFARTYHREKLAPGLFESPVVPVFETPRTWAQLDKVYYASAPDLFERSANLLERHPDLFAPPFRELKNAADGRKWKVRTSGTMVEIEIELDDGTSIKRERRCASAEKAEAEARALIAEQLADGFVESR